MMQFRGMELDFDVYDADQAEVYEEALARAVEASGEKVPGEGLADGIRRQCGAVFDFFDDLFGDGFHRDLFGERTNLRECLTAFQEFTEAVNSQKDKLTAEFAKAVPVQNRAARRTAARRPAAGA